MFGHGSRAWLDAHLRDMQGHWVRYGMATGSMPDLEYMFLEVGGQDKDQQAYCWNNGHVNAVLDALNLIKGGDPWCVVSSKS